MVLLKKPPTRVAVVGSCTLPTQNIWAPHILDRNMKYNGVEVDWISQWTLSYLCDADGWESTGSISAALTSYDGITDSKVRRRLRKMRNAGLVVCETEKRENVADANLYKPNPDALSDLDELSRPLAQSVDSNEMKKELEEVRVENNSLKSEIRELRSELELLQSRFNSRGSQRIARIEERQEYLMEHAEVTEIHLNAAAELYNEYSIDFDRYLKRTRNNN